MHMKKDAKLAALLAASEARGRGERVSASGGWSTINLPKRNKPVAPEIAAAAAYGAANGPIRILGMDTALRKTGWGIVEVKGRHFRAVDCGVIVNSKAASITDCMRHLNNAIKDLITKYSPDAATIEGGFYCKNARTAIILGTSRGAVLGVLAEAGLPVYEYAPTRAKQVVTGNGHASKEQVAAMVSHLLNIHIENLANDSTDALALAITHAVALSSPTSPPEEPL